MFVFVCALSVVSLRGITCGSFFFGRRHLCYSIGTLIVVVNFFFLFGRCVACDAMHMADDRGIGDSPYIIAYFSVAAALFNVGWAAVQVSHMALIPELTADETTRVVLNSVRYAATVSANLFVFLVLGLLIYVFDMPRVEQFHTLAVICIGVGLCTSIGFLIGTEEKRPKREQAEWEATLARRAQGTQRARAANVNEDYQRLPDGPDEPPAIIVQSSQVRPSKSVQPSLVRVEPVSSVSVSESSTDLLVDLGPDDSRSSSTDETIETTLDRRLRTMLPVHFTSWRTWLSQPEYWYAGLIYMFTRLVVNVSQVCLPFYVLDVLDLPNLYITIMPCTVYVSSMVAAAMMKRAHTRLGRKTTFVGGFVAVCAGCTGMIFLQPAHPWVWLIYPCAVAIGLGNGAVMVGCGSLTAELIGSRTNHGAFVFGTFSFGDKLATGAALFAFQSFNHDASEYIRLAATAPTMAAAALAVLLILVKVDLPAWRYKHTLPAMTVRDPENARRDTETIAAAGGLRSGSYEIERCDEREECDDASASLDAAAARATYPTIANSHDEYVYAIGSASLRSSVQALAALSAAPGEPAVLVE